MVLSSKQSHDESCTFRRLYKGNVRIEVAALQSDILDMLSGIYFKSANSFSIWARCYTFSNYLVVEAHLHGLHSYSVFAGLNFYKVEKTVFVRSDKTLCGKRFVEVTTKLMKRKRATCDYLGCGGRSR